MRVGVSVGCSKCFGIGKSQSAPDGVREAVGPRPGERYLQERQDYTAEVGTVLLILQEWWWPL